MKNDYLVFCTACGHLNGQSEVLCPNLETFLNFSILKGLGSKPVQLKPDVPTRNLQRDQAAVAEAGKAVWAPTCSERRSTRLRVLGFSVEVARDTCSCPGKSDIYSV